MKTTSKLFTRIAVIFLSALMLFTVTACDGTGNGGNGGNGNGIKITFMVEGQQYNKIIINEDGTFTFPENPTKDGMSFQGWYLDDGAWQNRITD